MGTRAYVDIGELGWSLYLSFHLRWRKKKKNESFAVFTFPDRFCLYRGIAEVHPVPEKYYSTFDWRHQSCMGIWKHDGKRVKRFFETSLPKGFNLVPGFEFTCGNKVRWTDNKIYAPFSYSKKLEGKREIIVLPRSRKMSVRRNLPKRFYRNLIEELCISFPNLIVRSMGIKAGSYFIDNVEKKNYRNSVKGESDLQNLIDRCQLAVVAIGAQSAPPKLTLLQGVPTFIIGHEKERHVRR